MGKKSFKNKIHIKKVNNTNNIDKKSEVEENDIEKTNISQENQSENKESKNTIKKIKIITGIIIILLFGYFIFANNYVSFYNPKSQQLTKEEAIAYNIEYKTLPGCFVTIKSYIDDDLIETDNILITDGFHKIKIKCGLMEITKNIYSYNGITADTKSNDILKYLDSDKDGLSDIYENNNGLNKYLADTDGDKYLDNTEIILKLDINQQDDFTMQRELKIEHNDTKLTVNGLGNFTNIFIDDVHNEFITNKEINIVDPVEIHSEYDIDNSTNKEGVISAKIEFKVNELEDAVIYKINEVDNSYEELDTIINNGIASANLTEFGIYGVANKSKLEEFNNKIEIAFVIDNSATLFSKTDYELITGTKFNGNDDLLGKDTEQNRIKLTKQLISNLNTKFNTSITCFNGEVNVVNKMSDEFLNINTKLDNMLYSYVKFNGSYLGKGISTGISTFNENAYKKYIILIADGSNISSKDTKLEKIIKEINDNNINLIVVKTQNANNKLLTKLVDNTNGMMFDITDETTYSQIYSILKNNAIQKEKELNVGGEKTFVYELATIDFDTKNKLSIKNFRTNTSNLGITNNSLGISLVEKLIYQKILPTTLSKVTNANTDINKLQEYYNVNKLNFEDITLTENNITLLNGDLSQISNSTLIDYQNYMDNINNTKYITFNDEYKNKLKDININFENKAIFTSNDETGGTIEVLNVDDLAFDLSNSEITNLDTPDNINLLQYINRLQYTTISVDLNESANQELKEEIKKTNPEIEYNDIDYIVYKLNNNEPVLISFYSETDKKTVLVHSIYKDKIDKTKYYIEFNNPEYPEEFKLAILKRVEGNNQSFIINYNNYNNIKVERLLYILTDDENIIIK